MRDILNQYKKLPRFSKNVRNRIRLYLILNFLISIVSVTPSLLTKYLFSNIVKENSLKKIMIWIFMTLITIIIYNILYFYFVSFEGDRLATVISNELRLEQLKRYYQIPIIKTSTMERSLIFNSVYGETTMIAVTYVNILTLLILTFQIIFYFFIILTNSLLFGLLSIFLVILYGLSTVFNTNKFQQSVEDERVAMDKLTGRIHEAVDMHKDVQIYNNAPYILEYVNKKLKIWEKVRIRYNFWYTLMLQIPQVLADLCPALIYGIGSLLIIKNQATLADMIFASQFIPILFSVVKMFASMMVEQKNSVPYFKRFFSIFDAVPKSEPNINYRSVPINIKNKKIFRKNRLLFKINELIIQDNGIYLIKGTNGTGKSTLLTQMAGLGDEKSEVVVSKELYGYFDNLGMIIEGTTTDNIIFGNGALNQYFYDIVEILNIDFLNKKIKNSSSLSLGQKQKILLARFFFSSIEKKILFLDEPFSNLDGSTIESLIKYLKKLSIRKGIVLISHDAFADQLSDIIYLIDPKSKEIKRIK